MRRVAAIALLLAVAACGGTNEVSRDVGARCDTNDECSGRCLTGGDYPGGFCTVACDSDADCTGGSVCVDVEGGICLFPCGAAGDCAFLGAGWSCMDETTHPSNEPVMACRGG